MTVHANGRQDDVAGATREIAGVLVQRRGTPRSTIAGGRVTVRRILLSYVTPAGLIPGIIYPGGN